MNLLNKKLVLFDFDGVLVNTLPSSFLEHKKLNESLTWEKFQDFSNGNFHEGVINAVKDGAHNVPDKWDDLYTENIKELSISDVLNKTIIELSSMCLLTIVSSSSTKVIDNFLLKEKIRENFSDILGTDIHISKIVKINSILKKYNILPNDAVFITDSLGDILEGNKCGVKSIGVTWGIHPRETLEKGNPVGIIDDPRDLLDAVQNVLK